MIRPETGAREQSKSNSTSAGRFSSLRVGVLGLGSVGRRHAENAIALGVGDVVLGRSGRAAHVPNPLGLTEYHGIERLIDARPDAVVVATPTALHVSAATRLVDAGIPVLLEKPLSHTREGVDELRDAVRRSGTTVMPAHNMRFHGGVVAAQRHLFGGAVGVPLTSRFFVGQYLPHWRPGTDYRASYSANPELGGGVTLDLIHEIDVALWWAGPFARLTAWSGHVSALEIRTEDVTEILLSTTRGGVATIHMDYLHHPYSRWYEVTGDRGTLRYDYVSHRLSIASANGAAASDIPLAPTERNEMYVALLEHFLAVVIRDASPRLTMDDAVAALDVALTARKAAAASAWLPLDSAT